MGGDNAGGRVKVSGTTMKDTWTKPRGVESGQAGANGWGQREWWGKKADNCT